MSRVSSSLLHSFELTLLYTTEALAASDYPLACKQWQRKSWARGVTRGRAPVDSSGGRMIAGEATLLG